MHVATKEGNIDVLKFLFQVGANRNLPVSQWTHYTHTHTDTHINTDVHMLINMFVFSSGHIQWPYSSPLCSGARELHNVQLPTGEQLQRQCCYLFWYVYTSQLCRVCVLVYVVWVSFGCDTCCRCT